jgi:hypothetical protein
VAGVARLASVLAVASLRLAGRSAHEAATTARITSGVAILATGSPDAAC